MTNQTIQALLKGAHEDHILPFLWLHGEDEPTLRRMMAAIHNANCGSVCVESRPHPDFCGPKWWEDMDVILDEARKRNMRVWILDDKHYPTGYANGALHHADTELCRQNIFCHTMTLSEEPYTLAIDLRQEGLMDSPLPTKEDIRLGYMPSPPQLVFPDSTDKLLTVQAVDEQGEILDLSPYLEGERLRWDKPSGKFTLQVVTASHNTGFHRDYINTTDKNSVKLLIDQVYEPHWQRYKEDFGKTIAGFFSDEPNLGNGPVYTKGNLLGCGQDLPWGRELEKTLAHNMGPDWRKWLPKLFCQDQDDQTCQTHMAYMEALTTLVRENFSQQIAQWCHQHGVLYIGHVIEDDGQHCRTGSSLGHYFRGLHAQDMSGIDDIGGQVLPQGEDAPFTNPKRRPRNGEFYHYGLATLAASAAAIEPHKQGRAMCEIFGNYGWSEGVRLEKYLADHFLVRGINYFVPHAFTAKPFPDPDCPPHFYAQGHNPQHRHFGHLMAYMNRVATLISSGPHPTPVAILYHGEAEWCDPQAMPFEKVLHPLYDRQFHCHVLPADVFSQPEEYQAKLEAPLVVNGNTYHCFVVPGAARLPGSAARGLALLVEKGFPVFFAQRRPDGLCEGGPLPSSLQECPVVSLEQLPEVLEHANVERPIPIPPCDRLRLLTINGNTTCVLFSNEGVSPYQGNVTFPHLHGPCYWYDPWENQCSPACVSSTEQGVTVTAEIEPLKLKALVFGEPPVPLVSSPVPGNPIPIGSWTRALCPAIRYPQFSQAEPVCLPDPLTRQHPDFSGIARYETTFSLDEPKTVLLTIEDASEAVEVFLNGKSQGIQVAPPFRYRLEGTPGQNTLAIEVATTLEWQCFAMLNCQETPGLPVPTEQNGLTGVALWEAQSL